MPQEGKRAINLWKTHLWGIGVVEHAEDNSGHWVLSVGHVSRWCERGQVVLQGLAQHAVKGYVRAQDVPLLPAVLLQLLDLGPQTVQVLGDKKVVKIFKFPYN